MTLVFLCVAAIVIIVGVVGIDDELTNKTIVFISGWPQSGTSMIHKILSLHTHVSTMMEKCLERHGRRCENWNYEGQWLLSNSGLKNAFRSGASCPIAFLHNNTKLDIRNEVGKNSILVGAMLL